MTLIRWRKSSFSGNQGNCVELAHTRTAIRDSKNPAGPVLLVPGLDHLISTVKSGWSPS